METLVDVEVVEGDDWYGGLKGRNRLSCFYIEREAEGLARRRSQRG